MILAALLPIFLAAFDIGEAFSSPEAWEESAVDFAVDRAKDGFKFASAKRDAVVCLRKGACTWHDIEVWEARIHYGAAGSGATRIEFSLYNRGDDRTGDGLTEADFRTMREKISAALAPLKPGKVEKNPALDRRKSTGGTDLGHDWRQVAGPQRGIRPSHPYSTAGRGRTEKIRQEIRRRNAGEDEIYQGERPAQ